MTDSPTIMSIRELIETAFGDPETNTVNHKLIQTIMIILARQLRILERQVGIEITSHYNLPITGTSLSVSEIKLHANVEKMKRPGQHAHDEQAGGKALTTKASKTSLDKPSGKQRPLKKITEGSSSDREKSDQTPSLTDESSTEKYSTEKSTDKSKSTSSGKTGTEKSSSSRSKSDKTKSSSKDASSSASRGDLKTLLENIELKRERLIRVIKQKADSREERDRTPTPMASLDSMERQYEKLLVERVPAEEAKRADKDRSKSQRLSIVTQAEFEELSVAVRHLQKQFKLTDTPGFPDNAQLLEDLRKGASLTDAMAALQLSARIEATEKTLQKMLSLVTELAKHTGVNIEETAQSALGPTGAATKKKKDDSDKETAVLFDAEEARSTAKPPVSPKIKKIGQKSSKESLGSQEEFGVQTTRGRLASDVESKDFVTADELDEVMQHLYDELVKMVETATAASSTSANNALRIANRLETKLDASLNLGDRMDDLERAVYEYAEQVNTLDTGLSSQMTNYQELLTQMQHDLESSVETMQEALANTGGDTAAVAELNNHFTNLQMDFDVASMMQKDLRDTLEALSLDIQSLWKQIEILRDFKSDRDEVTDALRDKAGLAALNGLVSRQEFDAVRGDFEKRIAASYDKFNNQETVWQKAIDELLRILNEKADWIQVVSLQESIYKYLQKFQSKINAMMEIVGEPRAATIARKLHRDAACLSCATPAHMEQEVNTKHQLPAFRSSRATAEAETKPSEDGDHHGVCYPGLAIPHPIDPRAHVCNRYCGGSHTVINNTIGRVPPSMTISPAIRQVTTAIGSDGKAYMIDDMVPQKPCKQCNIPQKQPEPKEAEPAPVEVPDYKSSDMTPSDYRESGNQFIEDPSDMMHQSEMSTTPPHPDSTKY